MRKNLSGLGVAIALAVCAAVRGQAQIVYTLPTLTTAPLAGPPDPLPVLNGVWNIPQYNGVLPLSEIRLELTTTLTYQGQLVSELLAGSNFQLQVGSDFTINFLPAAPGTVTVLDPVILLNLLTGIQNTPFPASGVASLSQTTTLTGADMSAYLGAGNVPVTVNGILLTLPIAGWHNNTDNPSSQSPATFVNNVKVFPVDGTQEYQLEALLRVTYLVPEAQTPIAALLGISAGWYLLRRRQLSGR